jgi:hypothetical protein
MTRFENAERAMRSAAARHARAKRKVISSRALVALWRSKKSLAKAPARTTTCSLCRAGDHEWCGGLAYVDRRRLSRRTACGCLCRKVRIA